MLVTSKHTAFDTLFLRQALGFLTADVTEAFNQAKAYKITLVNPQCNIAPDLPNEEFHTLMMRFVNKHSPLGAVWDLLCCTQMNIKDDGDICLHNIFSIHLSTMIFQSTVNILIRMSTNCKVLPYLITLNEF